MRGLDIEVGRGLRCYGKVAVRGKGRLRIGNDCVFSVNLNHVYLGHGSGGYDITIGDKVWLNGTSISAVGRVAIGHRSLVGRSELIDHEYHDPRDLSRKREVRAAPILLEDDTWVGNDCLILKGVTIGRFSVVGARTVVRRSLPEKVVAIGNPAQIVKKLD